MAICKIQCCVSNVSGKSKEVFVGTVVCSNEKHNLWQSFSLLAHFTLFFMLCRSVWGVTITYFDKSWKPLLFWIALIILASNIKFISGLYFKIVRRRARLKYFIQFGASFATHRAIAVHWRLRRYVCGKWLKNVLQSLFRANFCFGTRQNSVNKHSIFQSPLFIVTTSDIKSPPPSGKSANSFQFVANKNVSLIPENDCCFDSIRQY